VNCRSATDEGFNQPKTLSGIETDPPRRFCLRAFASTNLKPFQGLKPERDYDISEPRQYSFNQPKTLSGIETQLTPRSPLITALASTNLKPFQGLKQMS